MRFDNFIPVIPMEDDPIHTESQRFCSDPTCGCHEEPALVNAVNAEYRNGLLTEEEATRIVEGKQV